jgi:hypothetical protein
MLRPDYRSAYVTTVLTGVSLVLGATVAEPASAQQPAPENDAKDVKASMQCDRASEPGRVRCSVEARIEGGRTIAWADVEILSLPDFASALKGRIAPQDAVARDATSAKWGLGLVAKHAGQGEARARVRIVACDAPRPAASGAPAPPPRCTPVTVEVKAQVTVSG